MYLFKRYLDRFKFLWTTVKCQFDRSAPGFFCTIRVQSGSSGGQKERQEVKDQGRCKRFGCRGQWKWPETQTRYEKSDAYSFGASCLESDLLPTGNNCCREGQIFPPSFLKGTYMDLFTAFFPPSLPPVKARAKITAYLCSLSTSPQDRTDWERKCLDSCPHFSFIVTFLDKPVPVGSFPNNVLTATFWFVPKKKKKSGKWWWLHPASAKQAWSNDGKLKLVYQY